MSAAGGSLPRYIVQRILLVIPMIWVLVTVVFLLLRVAPGDPVSAMFGGKLSAAAMAQRRHQLGLDQPLYAQYFGYLWDVIRFRFGTSLSENRSIISIVALNGQCTSRFAKIVVVTARRSLPFGPKSLRGYHHLAAVSLERFVPEGA